MSLTAQEIIATLEGMADAAKAAHAQRYFKTAPGQYGHGDKFLGIRVPALRKLVRSYAGLSRPEVVALLGSPYHEARLLALLILVRHFVTGDAAQQQGIYALYLKHTRHINNWDLVDVSAPNIVGGYLADKDRKPLYRLAKSRSLWERRIAMLATLTFIRRNDVADALAIARVLRNDPHDLIHKAVGWMLREVGKRDLPALTAFLDDHAARMPRTMLRYAIEKFPPPARQHYLQQKRPND